ncbi:hypothetical protein [Cellvibrio mixtus]|uniref:hypothetical protein n=1 Tax=Cellvibrio mixtus TaxID=39650 RepID=UPI00058767B3|nr:hypothetical protein [Cellvibrio mixtus]
MKIPVEFYKPGYKNQTTLIIGPLSIDFFQFKNIEFYRDFIIIRPNKMPAQESIKKLLIGISTTKPTPYYNELK